MSIELKPCPFCGGEAKAREWAAWSPTIQGVTSVACTECVAEIEVDAAELWLHDAAWYWNSRAERTCKNVHEPPTTSTFWPSPHFKCSECGATHVSVDYVYFCPNCGAKVVEE